MFLVRRTCPIQRGIKRKEAIFIQNNGHFVRCCGKFRCSSRWGKWWRWCDNAHPWGGRCYARNEVSLKLLRVLPQLQAPEMWSSERIHVAFLHETMCSFMYCEMLNVERLPVIGKFHRQQHFSQVVRMSSKGLVRSVGNQP